MSHDHNLIEEWLQRYTQGYFDSTNGALKLEYVQRSSIEPLAKAMANSFPKLNRHQIRRFFQHCRAVERQLKSHSKTWDEVRPDIEKLDGAVSDAYFKSEKKIPLLFHEFIKNNIVAIHCERDFQEGFLRHFEALVAFGQQYFEEKDRT